MPRLFTYTIPVDDGAAPNPFNGMCSLAICKPGIRRVAQPDDWVAGLGSKQTRTNARNLSGHLVYAMRVEEVLTLQDYDRLALSRWPHRIPNVTSTSLIERLGDCIYDYSNGVPPTQRRSVHVAANIRTDLSGKNVLLSRDFYYFGNQAIRLPQKLVPICHQTQGHKSEKNAPHVQSFVEWLRSLERTPGQLYGDPNFDVNWDSIASCSSCSIRQKDDEDDPEC